MLKRRPQRAWKIYIDSTGHWITLRNVNGLTAGWEGWVVGRWVDKLVLSKRWYYPAMALFLKYLVPRPKTGPMGLGLFLFFRAWKASATFYVGTVGGGVRLPRQLSIMSQFSSLIYLISQKATFSGLFFTVHQNICILHRLISRLRMRHSIGQELKKTLLTEIRFTLTKQCQQ